jgi:fructose-1,6-bisphosphatase/inositol monophosphatase family enzyme
MHFVHEEHFDLESLPIRREELTAVIDPIDGTAVFSMHLPLWSVSVGIFLGHTPLYGFVYAPGCGLLFHNDDTTSYCNGYPLKADNDMTIDSETSILCSSENIRQFDFDFPGKIRNLGSTALHACLTADNRRNRVLAFVGNSSLWDWAGALPVLSHAGVAVSYLNGSKPDLREVADNRYAFPDHLVAYNTLKVNEIQKIFQRREGYKK